MIWEHVTYKLAELILSCVLLRTSSSGLRLRQDVLYRSHNATRFARRAHFYNSSLSLVHVFLLPHLPHIPASMAKTPRKKKGKVPFQQDVAPGIRCITGSLVVKVCSRAVPVLPRVQDVPDVPSEGP